MEYGKNLTVKWKIFGMEWKKFCSMEYGKIVFHSIACPAKRWSECVHARCSKIFEIGTKLCCPSDP